MTTVLNSLYRNACAGVNVGKLAAVALVVFVLVLVVGCGGAGPAMVDGVCGAANGTSQTAVTTNSAMPLCSSGSVADFSGAGPWRWKCAGQNGGVPASCSANAVPNVANAGSIPTPENIGGKTVLEGPIFATSGQVIDNKHVSSSTGACIIIPHDVSNVVISNSEIGPCKSSATEFANGVAALERTTNITIDHNVIHDVKAGAYFYQSRHPINFHHNFVYNINGPFPAGQMIQFHTVNSGTSRSDITCNISDVQGMAQPGVEDHVSMWMSQGLANDHTEIAYNRIRGGTSRSGSAIQAGDGGGGNVWVHDNIIVNVGGGGAGIFGGQNLTIENNRIFADGHTSRSGVGIYVKNSTPDQPCANNTVRNNRVFTWNSAWYSPAIIENYGSDRSCETGYVKSGNSFDATGPYADPGDPELNASLFDESFAQCD